MSVVDAATATQIANIARRTGRSVDEWIALVRSSGAQKHGAIVSMLKTDHGFGHGDANLVAVLALRQDEAPQGDAAVDSIYEGRHAPVRRLHDAAQALVDRLGPDIERAPKKAYVSLRRKKQFATLGPASGGRLEIGLNLPGEAPGGRLEPTTGMCTHRVRIASADELDGEVVGWLRAAYDRAG
jgi:hypothetical protein